MKLKKDALLPSVGQSKGSVAPQKVQVDLATVTPQLSAARKTSGQFRESFGTSWNHQNSNMGSEAGELNYNNNAMSNGTRQPVQGKNWSQKDVEAKKQAHGQRTNQIGGNNEFDLSNFSETRNDNFYKGQENGQNKAVVEVRAPSTIVQNDA